MRYARSKNLTPYDVLIIASMIEREVVVPRERQLVAAVVYNRLRAGMPLQIDATLRYGLDIPPTEPITKDHLASDSPYNTRIRTGLPPTPIANPGLASMQAAAHPAKVDYIYFVRKPDCRSHFFTASAAEFEAYTRAGPPVLIGLLGYPLTARCRRGCRTPRLRVRPRLVLRARAGSRGTRRGGGGRPRRLGFAGANVLRRISSPCARLLRDGSAVGQYADRSRRAHRGALDGRSGPRRVVRRAAGDSSATAAPRRPFSMRCRTRRSSLRRGSWPPDVREADLVVNATSERDEVLAEVGSGQTLIDLPYPETATARAAAAAGAHVVTGLEVLIAQGAASFELWTGIPAPVDVMRRAVRSAA